MDKVNAVVKQVDDVIAKYPTVTQYGTYMFEMSFDEE
jgi:hypothetical protein